MKRQMSKRLRGVMRMRRIELAERDAKAKKAAGKSGHRQCGRKVRYPTKEAADDTALRVMAHEDVELRSYRCPICDGWHLTKQAKGYWDAT